MSQLSSSRRTSFVIAFGIAVSYPRRRDTPRSRRGAPCSDTSRCRLRTPAAFRTNNQPKPIGELRPTLEEPVMMTDAPDVAYAHDK
jgi:hypothetical protein